MVEYVVSVAGVVLVCPYSVTAPNVNTKGVMISVRMTLFIAKPPVVLPKSMAGAKVQTICLQVGGESAVHRGGSTVNRGESAVYSNERRSRQLRVGVVLHGFLSSGFCF